MAERNELEIVLTLIDEASAKLNKVLGDVKKDANSVEKETGKATKSMNVNWTRAALSIAGVVNIFRVLHRQIIDVIQVGKDIDPVFRASMDNFNLSVAKVKALIATELIPILKTAVDWWSEFLDKQGKGFHTDWQKSLTKDIEALNFKIEATTLQSDRLKASIESPWFMGDKVKRLREIADIEEKINGLLFQRGILEKARGGAKQVDTSYLVAKFHLEEYNAELERNKLLFLDNKLSVDDYYNSLIKGSISTIQNKMVEAQLTQQMAAQENLMRNQSLMNYKSDIDARMGLLKTLQSYHHTAYSAMFDFVNMGIQKFSTGFTTALTSIIMGTKRTGEAFKEFGIAMITAIVEFVIQYGIQMLIAAALSKLVIGWTIGQAGVLAAAWLPAAVFASVATLGGAGALGAAGLGVAGAAATGIMGISKLAGLGKVSSGARSGFASGGWIPEPILGIGASGKKYTFGEEGPEYIIPNNRLGNMGSQTSIHIEINNPVVRSDEDIDLLTEQISLRLAREAERL